MFFNQKYIEEKHQREIEERKNILIDKLAAHGLQLRDDSVLCNSYIDRGRGDLNKIVKTMKEMDWYYKNTDYSSNVSAVYEERLD